jgi:hypothetical protein
MTATSTPRVYDHRRRKRYRQGRCTPAPTPVSSAGRTGELRGLAYARDWNHDRALRTATGRHSVARCQRRRACE